MKFSNHLRTRPGLNTALGIAFATIAGLLLLGYLSALLTAKRGGPLLDVPTARRDIEIGELIRDDMVGLKKIPDRYLVPGTIKNRDDIKGGRALRFIGKGEPFTQSSIYGRKAGSTLASRIPENMRAYSLQPGRSTAGQELRAGDRVDVLATSGDPPRTRTILRDKLIVSAGRRVASDGAQETQGTERITVLVSPAEVETLAQAECEGEISISLCPLAPAESGGR
jgi:Flp pilus assembly protein CpaB